MTNTSDQRQIRSTLIIISDTNWVTAWLLIWLFWRIKCGIAVQKRRQLHTQLTIIDIQGRFILQDNRHKSYVCVISIRMVKRVRSARSAWGGSRRRLGAYSSIAHYCLELPCLLMITMPLIGSCTEYSTIKHNWAGQFDYGSIIITTSQPG